LIRALAGKLRWFGCRLREVLDLPRDAASIRQAMERRTETLLLVSGTNALDPLDPVFAALEQLGARMQRIGMPVHPGTLLWIATWRDATIIGLPSCGLGPQVTGFDLVLPKLLAEGAIRDEDLAGLGHGGILNFARARALNVEPADEPVR
jgi:molybdopterin biosynthesis enzyme